MRKPRAGGHQARARRIGETQVKTSVMGRCSGALVILTLVGAVAQAGSKQDIADCLDWSGGRDAEKSTFAREP